MSNDWTIVPLCGVDLNGDPGTGDNAPHCVVWDFPDKATAQNFAVKAEYIDQHGIDLGAAAVALDSLKACGGDKDRVIQAALATGIATQLKLNRAMSLLERACNGDDAMVQKIRKLVETV
jgi:hypothetical protein